MRLIDWIVRMILLVSRAVMVIVRAGRVRMGAILVIVRVILVIGRAVMVIVRAGRVRMGVIPGDRSSEELIRCHLIGISRSHGGITRFAA